MSGARSKWTAGLPGRRASGFYKMHPRAYIYIYIRESAGPAVHRSTPL